MEETPERGFAENHRFLPPREEGGGQRSPPLPCFSPLRGEGGGGVRRGAVGAEGGGGRRMDAGMINTNFSSPLAAPRSSPPSFSSSPFII